MTQNSHYIKNHGIYYKQNNVIEIGITLNANYYSYSFYFEFKDY